MRQVTITKLFQKNARKLFEFEDIMVTFPSYGLMIKSSFDLKNFIESENEGGTTNCSIIVLPQSSANQVLGYLERHYPSEYVSSFYKRHPILIDWETEYWYLSNQFVSKRKKSFSKIPGKPKGWDVLFDGDANKNKGAVKQHKNYVSRLQSFFQNEGNSLKLINSTMTYAYNNLKSSIILPPTPLIKNTGYSLQVSLDMNRWFNQLRRTKKLISGCSYNLHHQAFNQESTHQEIIKQLYDLTPQVVFITTPSSENYLEEYVYSKKKPLFENFVKEVALYGLTNHAIIIWNDKGHYTSNFGMRLLKEGFDCFTYPLKGTCKEGGGGSIPYGERFAAILDEYRYTKWNRFLTRVKNQGVSCHLPCCENESFSTLSALTDRQQWNFKRKHEIQTRNEQLRQFIEKLSAEGNLDDYEFRLRRNEL